MDDLTAALADFGCEFLSLELDCPHRNVDALSDILHEECACENITNKQTSESQRFTIICTTQTGITDIEDEEEEPAAPAKKRLKK